MVYELVGRSTDSRESDVRWRVYTSSEKYAEEWRSIEPIQFTDSGHKVLFEARELPPGTKRKRQRAPRLDDHPARELALMRIKLSAPQLELLLDLDKAQYGELRLGGAYLRVGAKLVRLGLAQSTQRVYSLTENGRKLAKRRRTENRDR